MSTHLSSAVPATFKHVDVREGVASKKQLFDLPLVSIIVVNYNYGRFLSAAVESICNQSYPNIELIIVDDASTDESSNVLDLLTDLYSDAKIVRRQENGGQSAASRSGFERSSGDYIIFVDADDMLLVATHIFVHLSLRVPGRLLIFRHAANGRQTRRNWNATIFQRLC